MLCCSGGAASLGAVKFRRPTQAGRQAGRSGRQGIVSCKHSPCRCQVLLLPLCELLTALQLLPRLWPWLLRAALTPLQLWPRLWPWLLCLLCDCCLCAALTPLQLATAVQLLLCEVLTQWADQMRSAAKQKSRSTLCVQSLAEQHQPLPGMHLSACYSNPSSLPAPSPPQHSAQLTSLSVRDT